MAKGNVLWLLAIFVLAFSLIVGAEEKVDNYNAVQYLDVSVVISSGINVQFGDGYSIEYIKSDLSFFPKDDDRQSVSYLNKLAEPGAAIQEKVDMLSYTWTSGISETIEYGFDSKVRVNNEISRIKDKISFPVTKFDATTLKYTQETEFIDINSEIEAKAYEILGIEDDYYAAVFKLAEWTEKNIEYNLTTLTADVVQPSSWVLKNRKGVCDEMTNLFISFMRSVGIPARFVSGMVYTNLDYDWGPHGWAEVYFPDYGWIPFDVTFAEYGWLNPSHVKLKDNIDSGSPTAEYSWKSNGVDVSINKLDIKTLALGVGPKEVSAIELEVIPSTTTSGFGSYVPVGVRVRNIKDTYIAPRIVITKAPELTETNVKRILLRPKEEKTLYWIVNIPEADPNYIYTTTIEAKGVFGEIASSTIKYGDEFELYSKEYAEKIVSAHVERIGKEELSEISVKCGTDKKTYYSGGEARIDCVIKNEAEEKVLFDVCFQEECNSISINTGEKITESNTLVVSDSMRLPVIFDSPDKAKYVYVSVDVIPIPEITINNLDPGEANYGDDVEISFDIGSNTDVTELVIEFDFDVLSYDSFGKGEARTIVVHTQGKQLLDDMKFRISYKDELDKEYSEEKALHVNVLNVPWYGNAFNWLRNLF
tara:strand:- start:10838 stop:12781 length:1944 start_codon:yes stop_codon:yes gene_type:complete